MFQRWLAGLLGLITTTGLAWGGTPPVPAVEFTQDEARARLLGGGARGQRVRR